MIVIQLCDYTKNHQIVHFFFWYCGLNPEVLHHPASANWGAGIPGAHQTSISFLSSFFMFYSPLWNALTSIYSNFISSKFISSSMFYTTPSIYSEYLHSTVLHLLLNITIFYVVLHSQLNFKRENYITWYFFTVFSKTQGTVISTSGNKKR